MAGYKALPIVISHLSAFVKKFHLYTRIAEQSGPQKTQRICLSVVREIVFAKNFPCKYVSLYAPLKTKLNFAQNMQPKQTVLATNFHNSII